MTCASPGRDLTRHVYDEEACARRKRYATNIMVDEAEQALNIRTISEKIQKPKDLLEPQKSAAFRKHSEKEVLNVNWIFC